MAVTLPSVQVGDLVRASEPTMVKYESADGKVVLYKPTDWQVTEGKTFGQGVYSVVVMEPYENAVALFMTLPVNQEIKDSVALPAKCIAALREESAHLQATNMNSVPDRERTMAELTLTDEGEKGIGHGYFFCTQSIGTFYLLPAESQVWDESRPTLTAIMANLAFAPQGAAAAQEQGQRLAGRIGEDIALCTMEYYEGSLGGGNLIPRLVGVLSPVEREFFSTFISVKGLGIRKGLRALSIPIVDVAGAIEAGNEKVLMTLAGIGRKMAQQIVAELKGKLEAFAFGAEPAARAAQTRLKPFQAEAIEILVAWGEKRNEAMELIELAGQRHA